jgi:hypothetical protein
LLCKRKIKTFRELSTFIDLEDLEVGSQLLAISKIWWPFYTLEIPDLFTPSVMFNFTMRAVFTASNILGAAILYSDTANCFSYSKRCCTVENISIRIRSRFGCLVIYPLS